MKNADICPYLRFVLDHITRKEICSEKFVGSNSRNRDDKIEKSRLHGMEVKSEKSFCHIFQQRIHCTYDIETWVGVKCQTCKIFKRRFEILLGNDDIFE